MLLEKVNSPADIRKFNTGQLKQLCAEIRQYMVECCAKNPGHLGSSLGAVELIVGLHAVYDTPKDKLVFDVGHQAYAHKILTGRRDAFKRNRTREGISGFPKRDESPYDPFGAGHSSTAISAALGFAEAARLTGSKERAVALVGDGALTGGLAWEGLNNAGSSKAMGEGKLRDWVQRRVMDTKSNLVRVSGGAVFESLGFRYFGPIDGNDIAQVTETLRRLRDLKGPRILHVITQKGMGYAPAEADPTTWHAPGRFDPATGERKKTVYPAARYQDVFGETLVELARQDPKVVGITPAMATGCGMHLLEKAFPDRFFDVGIEEEHAVTFSAGLAAAGMKPFCNIYSSFAQRAYDEIVHDVALQNLPVVLCFDRAGLVGEDGATHHGCFDLAAYRSIPNTVIAAPRNERELKNLMYTGLTMKGGPYIIRYPRGCGEGVDWKDVPFENLLVGRGEKLLEGKDVAILALGPVANRALEAALRHKTDYWVAPSVYDMRWLKPLDTNILEAVSRCRVVITLEDGTLKGGLFSAVCEYFAGRDEAPIVKGLGIPDKFIAQDTQAAQWAECCLDTESIYGILVDVMKK